MLTTEELSKLENAKSEREWNAICDEVKRARNGQYPSDWYAKVIQSGLARRVSAKWGGTDEIRVQSF